MSTDDLEERLLAALPRLQKLNAAVKFDLGDDGSWCVDTRTTPLALHAADGETDADCTIKISAENLGKLIDGKLDPMLAYGLGKIKVSGSMGVAMKLVAALG
jgi:putative sterol carrier protein